MESETRSYGVASAGGGGVEEVNLERMEWDLRARNWQELIERCSG